MKRLSYTLTLLLAMLLAGACTTPRSTEPTATLPPVIGQSPEYPVDLRGATLYQISPTASTVHILVYRGGTLANLGHNHVVTSKSVKGYVWRHAETNLCGFDIAMPVAELIVDDNDARAAQGADFPINVPDTARQGTQRNMLSEALLDAEHYPVIRLQSANISGDISMPRIVVHITIKDQMHLYTLPVTVQIDAHHLRVKGEFALKQTEFGIKPYSVAMGALQVQDELQIKFDLQADVMQPNLSQNVSDDESSGLWRW
jgi:polyisoprenoid-binding protein YceI